MEIVSHRNAQTLVSWIILDSAKLTITVNHHSMFPLHTCGPEWSFLHIIVVLLLHSFNTHWRLVIRRDLGIEKLDVVPDILELEQSSGGDTY